MPCGVHIWAAVCALPLALAGAKAPPARPLVGFAINAHHIGDLSLYLQSVDSIADLGANGLLLVTPMFQKRADSNEIRYLPEKCPTPEQLLAILQRARSRGLQTTLLPIVLIEEPGEDDWRGLLRPTDRDAWWASYDRFIDRYLELAVTAKVDVLSVGSELNSTEADLERWTAIIDRVRGRFPGAVTYTANWDRFTAVTFWGLLDLISISSYFELAPQDPDASPEELRRAWKSQQRRILQFARRHDRPFMLMELGYPSLPWAAAHPWNYVPRDGVAPDHEAQARCYRAFFETWSETTHRWPDLALGFHCYYWDPYHRGGPTDTGYGVRGKPALEVIRDAFSRIRDRADRETD